MIEEAIANSFNPIITHTNKNPTNRICIADLGCSTGPNTFIAIQTIIQAIQSYYVPNIAVANRDSINLNSMFHKLFPSDETIEFLVFFNDQVSNDFNTLFKNLPNYNLNNKTYFACGVPGSFHGRLFPKQTLHFVHSSASLNWLSEVPWEIMDRRSSAWNKGRIHCTNAPKEVRDAYEAQFKQDFESFLDARAQEVVGNGLMALQISTTPDHMTVESSDIDPNRAFELIGSSLMDMAKAGIISEDKVDSFNLPIIYPPIKGVKEIVERNEFFSIETMEALNFEDFYAFPNANIFVSIYRAVVEDLIEKHFGGAIGDDLFDRFTQKVVEFPEILNPNNFKMAMLFVLLKRKIDVTSTEAILARAKATAEGLALVSHTLKEDGGLEAASLRIGEQYIKAFGNIAKKDTTLWTTAPLSEVEPAAESLFHVTVDLSDSLDLAASHTRAGQYLQLRVPDVDKPSFLAIASPPKLASARGVFEFLVKSVAGSTAEILCGLKKGDVVELSPVMGNGFDMSRIDPPEKYTTVLIFATGSGISPIRSLVESEFSAGKRSDVRLYYGARNLQRMAYQDRFKDWESSGVKIVPVLSQPDGSWTGETGYVQAAFTRAKQISNPLSTGVVLCGQKQMTEEVTSILVADGVSSEKILKNF
ncbi:fruit protein pKIWI502 [Senna tora]|uniref:Fruit protein pKIWI502 n=1 Tax=Senna tora TaxID=362788 RepID=A0A834WRR9_9FABA|nr:fruit protein pKIWI502 [Senna tora]